MQRLSFNKEIYGEYRITRIKESIYTLLLLCAMLLCVIVALMSGALTNWLFSLPIIIAVIIGAIVYYFSFWTINSDAKELTESYVEYDNNSLIYKKWYLYGEHSKGESFLVYKYTIDLSSVVKVKKRDNYYILKGDFKCERKTRDLTSFYTCNSIKIPMYYKNISCAIDKLNVIK